MGSESVSGAWVTRGVSGWRPPKGECGLHLLLAAGGPSAGATSGVSSGVTWWVMGVYHPSAEIQQRSEALLDDDRETGQVCPADVGWLLYIAGA